MEEFNFIKWKTLFIILAVQTTWVLSIENPSTSMSAKSTSPLTSALYRTPREDYTGDGRSARFFGDYWNRVTRPQTQTPASGAGAGGYNNYDRRGGGAYEDRNWYYQPDRYDYYNYYRNRYDDRGSQSQYGNRYDDRYDRYDYNRPAYNGGGGSSGYDRYDSRTYPGYNYNDNRGNGYDNRDSMYYYNQQRGGGVNEYYGGGSRGGYDQRGGAGYGYDSRSYYDRDDRYPSTQSGRGYYDYKNYRPWDETYRGVSGFDNSGRGYYFANNPNEPQSSLPPTSSSSSSSSDLDRERPYSRPQTQYNHQYAQSPPRPIQQTPSSHYDNNSSTQNTGNRDKGYANEWNYSSNKNDIRDRDRDRDRVIPGRDYLGGKDSQSNTYGSRVRPTGLGTTSYLHDRETNSAPATTTHDDRNGDDNRRPTTDDDVSKTDVPQTTDDTKKMNTKDE